MATRTLFATLLVLCSDALVPGNQPGKPSLVTRSVATLPSPAVTDRVAREFVQRALVQDPPRKGNLAFIDDTWVTLEDDETVSPHAELSDARIDESLSSDTTPDYLDTAPRA